MSSGINKLIRTDVLVSYLKDEETSQIVRLVLNLLISVAASFLLYKLMPRFKDVFMKANLKGIDMSKKERYEM